MSGSSVAVPRATSRTIESREFRISKPRFAVRKPGSGPDQPGEHGRVTSYSRQDVLRILQISSHQLLGWERAGLIPSQQSYTFQDLGQLRTLRALREDDVSAASIRHSIVAMKAVAGMTNPLLEASLVRTGARLAFRCSRRHGRPHPPPAALRLRAPRTAQRRTRASPAAQARDQAVEAIAVQDLFLAAVQAEEAGEKNRAIALYEQILARDPNYAPPSSTWAPSTFICAAMAEPRSSIAAPPRPTRATCLPSSTWATCSTSWSAPRSRSRAYQQAVALAPRYADAHYNLALAYERKGRTRPALRHWQAYIRLDRTGPGPITPAARFASCLTAKSSPSPGARAILCRPPA